MNCEEYRQAIGADPAWDGGNEHVQGCSACRDYRAEMQAMDARIRRALAIEVPAITMPDLPAAEPGRVVALRRRPSSLAWFALAATVAIAAFVGVRMSGTQVQYDSLAEEVLAHVDHEPGSLRVTDVAVSDEQLRAVVPADVANLDHGPGLITYARSCPIRGHTVPHLVIQGKTGPVTILLMPEEHVDKPTQLDGENAKVVILPVGDGSIAIVGPAEEQLDTIQQDVLKSVTWTT